VTNVLKSVYTNLETFLGAHFYTRETKISKGAEKRQKTTFWAKKQVTSHRNSH
jgi:hypothetical protein